MAGEGGALGRAFVEIVVPRAQFESQMAGIGASFSAHSGAIVAMAQSMAAVIATANASVAGSYGQVVAALGPLLTAEQLAKLSTDQLALSFHHADVAAKALAAGGILVGTSMKAAAAGTFTAGTAAKATTLSFGSMITMMKAALPYMAAFAAITKTLSMASGATDAQREFNKELYQLWTLVDLNIEGIGDLGKEIRDLTYDYNVMAAHGTRAMYQIYSATFYGAEATEIFESAMKAAAAGVTDVLTAADMTTTVLNAYGMAASEATRVNDLLFTAVRFGKCVTGDTRVLLADGRYKRIDELEDGAKVVSFDGRSFLPMDASWVDQGVKPTVRLKTNLGREISTTWNHPYLTKDGWKKVSELQVGDQIAIPASLPFFGDKHVPEGKAAFLGLWLAEGTGGATSPEITTSEYGDRIVEWAREFECHVSRKTRSTARCPTYVLSTGRGSGINPAMTFLRELGLSGCGSRTKHIPEEIFSWDRESIATLLHWYFNGDGWLADYRKYEHGAGFHLGFASSSKQLVKDISHLLLRFGIMGRIRERPGTSSWTWESNRYQEVRRFVDMIGIDRPMNALVPTHAPAKTRKRYGVIDYDKIAAIEERGEEHVYDLCVPEFHNFVAEDIIAHNTTYEELANQFGRLAGVAAPAGARLEEMAAAIATLTRQGIMTDWAVTSLRQTIMSMFRPTGALADVIKGLGYETGRSLIQQNGFVGALKLVSEYAEKTGVPLENLFTNVRAITAVLPLVTTASAGLALDIQRMEAAFGTMDVAFQKVALSWEYQIEVLKSQINDVAITVGESLMPAIISFMEVIVGIGEGFAMMAELFGPIGEFFSALTGYMGAGAIAGGLLAAAVWGLNKALIALAAHPIVAGLMALSVVLGMIVGEVKKLTSDTNEAADALRDYAKLEAQLRRGEEPEPELPTQPLQIFRELGPAIEQITADVAGQITAWVASEQYALGELDEKKLEILQDTLQYTLARWEAERVAGKTIPTFAQDPVASIMTLGYLVDRLQIGGLLGGVTGQQTVMWEQIAEGVASAFGYTLEQVRTWDPYDPRLLDVSPLADAMREFVFEPLEGLVMDLPGYGAPGEEPVGPTFGGIDTGFRVSALPTAQGRMGMAIIEAWESFNALYASIQAGNVVVDEGQTRIEAMNAAWKELGDIPEAAEEWLKVMKGVVDIDPGVLATMEGMIAVMKEIAGLTSTFTSETLALIDAYLAAEEGSIAQAMWLDELAGRYKTLIGWEEQFAGVQSEAGQEILNLIEKLEDLGITAKKTADRLVDVASTLVSGIGGLISKFGGEGAQGLGNIMTAGGGALGALSAATAVGAGPVAAAAFIIAGLDFVFTMWNETVTEPAAEAEAKKEEAIDRGIAAADALTASFWNLVQSAESVARIQEEAAQIQVDIMSTLLGFLWPLADILSSITGLFIIQEETIEKEVEARQKLLSNLNVPLGWPINRIRFAAGTPGEAVEFDWGAGGAEEEEEPELLAWWEAAMVPFLTEIQAAIQPIVDFRDAVRAAYEEIYPSLIQGILPVLDTFGWTLGEISDWITDTFAPDLAEFAEGFGTFWTEKVDPFWQEDMGPQIAIWLQRIYDWFEPIIEFIEDSVWPWLTEDVWPAVQPYVEEILQFFEDLGNWVAENWDTIKVDLLANLETWLGNLVTAIKAAAEWIFDQLGIEYPWKEEKPKGPSESMWECILSGGTWTGTTCIAAGKTATPPPGNEIVEGFPGVAADIIADHGGFGGVMGSTGQWVPYTTINGVPVSQLFKGGIAMDPTLALIGEQRPEAVIPLDRLSSILSMQPAVSGMGGLNPLSPSARTGGVTINVNVSQQRLTSVIMSELRSANVNDAGVGFAPMRVDHG